MYITRVGDGDDYHQFRTINRLARYMRKYHVNDVRRCCQYGVSTYLYEGQNYISLYVGTIEDPKRELTDSELNRLNSLLVVKPKLNVPKGV